MMGPNTNFYHRRIIKDICQVDKRAEHYMSLRLNYINDKCKPFTKKLELMKIKTKKYQELCQEQKKIIEESREIQNLNHDILKLKDLTGFYEKVLDELEKMVFTIEDERDGLKVQKKLKKKQLIEIRRSLVLPLIQSVMLKPLQKSLPIIQKSDFSTNIKKIKLKPRIDLSLMKSDLSQQNQQKQPSNHVTSKQNLKQELMYKIQKFNNVDYLFRECFQKKKCIVNKMIGQLQSNLVKKKSIFLKVCNILSKEKEDQVIDFQQFKELDPDELVSLIISFPHVTNNLMDSFVQKRKRIAQILIKQSKIKL